jgi:hypothetical protein
MQEIIAFTLGNATFIAEFNLNTYSKWRTLTADEQ